ncbi:MAG: hypothetical protein ACE5JQ_17930 [Candidatus Methylomirabilales bacterium]
MGVRVSMVSMGNGNYIRFHIGDDVIHTFGLPTYRRVKVFWGFSSSRGKVRIEKARTGGYLLCRLPRARQVYFTISKGAVPDGTRTERHGSTECQSRIIDDKLEIDLPDWFFMGAERGPMLRIAE